MRTGKQSSPLIKHTHTPPPSNAPCAPLEQPRRRAHALGLRRAGGGRAWDPQRFSRDLRSALQTKGAPRLSLARSAVPVLWVVLARRASSALLYKGGGRKARALSLAASYSVRCEVYSRFVSLLLPPSPRPRRPSAVKLAEEKVNPPTPKKNNSNMEDSSMDMENMGSLRPQTFLFGKRAQRPPAGFLAFLLRLFLLLDSPFGWMGRRK